MNAEGLTHTDYLIKDASRRAIQAAGGCRKLSDMTRLDATRFSRCGQSTTREFLPLDVAVQIDAMGGDECDIILREWARQRGYVLQPVHLAPSDMRALEHIPSILKSVADLATLLVETEKLTPRGAAAAFQIADSGCLAFYAVKRSLAPSLVPA